MATKRNVAGSIIQRGERAFLVRVYTGRDPKTGKRKYHNHTVHGSKKDAKQYLNWFLHQKDVGSYIEPTKMTVNEYLDHWLKQSAINRFSERTYFDYVDTLHRYVRPSIGGLPLATLKPMDLQIFTNEMKAFGKNGLSPRTVRYTFDILRKALKQAVLWELLRKNPTEGVDLPRDPKKERSPLSEEEARRFSEAALFDRWGTLLLLALYTGMRPGEYLALKWSDIDFKKGNVTVQRALVKTKDGWDFGPTKTGDSRRSIPLPPVILEMLADHKLSQEAEIQKAGDKYLPLDLVFATNKGTPLNRLNIARRHFKPILKAAGLPETTRLYDLRHSACTLLMATGVPIRAISERMGHANPNQTLSTYGHVLPSMRLDATNAMTEILFGSPTA